MNNDMIMYGYGEGPELELGPSEELLPDDTFAEMWWAQHSYIYDDDSAVTSTSYDTISELLWVGRQSGRVTSYLAQSNANPAEKYSSFKVAEDPVLEVVPMYRAVVAVAQEAIKIYTTGGALLSKYLPFPTQDDSTPARTFSCAHLLQEYSSESGFVPTNIIAGSSDSYLSVFDISTGGHPVSMFHVEVPTTRIQSTPLYVGVAGSDGKVRLMDGGLRSEHVIHTLAAHSGSVLEMSMPYDGFHLVTCGMSGRAINPYDAKSPIIYSPDPLVKLFDIRMPERSIPLATFAVTPSFVSLVTPSADALKRLVVHDFPSSPSVLTVTAEGYFQLVPVDQESMQEPAPVIPSPFGEMGLGSVTAACSSSSGRMIALGSSTGAVVQMYLQHMVDVEEEEIAGAALASDAISFEVGSTMIAGNPLHSVVNLKSEPIEIPPSPAPPAPKQVSVNDPLLGTSYALLCKDSSILASSFWSTPRMYTARMRMPMTRRISDDLLASATFQEFIGSIPNPGFSPNSMIFGADRLKAYTPCDPRHASSSGTNDGPADPSKKTSSGPQWVATGVDGRKQSEVPHRYRRVQSHRGKDRMKIFHYHGYNTVRHVVGLENSIQRPWINPILQFLFSVPAVRQCAMDSQLRAYHQQVSHHSIWGELGLIFHMMQAMLEHADHHEASTKGVVSASNFHTIFQHSAAAATVGLLKDLLSNAGPRVVPVGELSHAVSNAEGNPSVEPASSSPITPESFSFKMQQTIQIFVKFLLQQMSKESELEMKWQSSNGGGNSVRGGATTSGNFKSVTAVLIASASDSTAVSSGVVTEDIVDKIFGTTVQTSTTFLQSGAVDTGASHRSIALELTYPPLLSGASSGTAASNKYIQAAKADANLMTAILKDCGHEFSVSVSSRWTSGISDSAPKFCSILWGGVMKETYMRGWCSASDSYEPFRQLKSMSLEDAPDILTVLCGDVLQPAPTSTPTNPTAGTASADVTSSKPTGKELVADLWRNMHSRDSDGPWLAPEVEMFKLPRQVIQRHVASNAGGSWTRDMLFVSELRHQSTKRRAESNQSDESPPIDAAANKDGTDTWIIYNGSNYITSKVPASILFQNALSATTVDGDSAAQPVHYDLLAVVSHVDDHYYNGTSTGSAKNGDNILCHPILHLKSHVADNKTTSSGDEQTTLKSSWVLMNDFAVSPSDILDATSFFKWKHPDVLFFSRKEFVAKLIEPTQLQKVPDSVLSTASLSVVSSLNAVPVAAIPKGTAISRGVGGSSNADRAQDERRFIAFDAEFVTVEVDQIVVGAYGQHVIGKEGRQVVARISLLAEGNDTKTVTGAGRPAKNRFDRTGRHDLQIPSVRQKSDSISAAPDTLSVPVQLLCDDYVLPAEPVLDYVTRFSGISADDLNPSLSSHPVIPHRAAILKLRYYVDAGCIFVGHGLIKDFEIANIYVPSEQIRDTVELWRLPNQRKISLRFLASYLLKAEIQDELHDSIEDAKTAYALYLLYERTLKARGIEGIGEILRDLYAYGNQNNWTLGLERIH